LWFSLSPRLTYVHVVEETTKALGLFQPYPLLKFNTEVKLEGSTEIYR
jgi:hypothetical protein